MTNAQEKRIIAVQSYLDVALWNTTEKTVTLPNSIVRLLASELEKARLDGRT